ncbi:MAG: hypothetical protein R3332_03705 [Pseudohongiellaceae bacterium]|nr:hypothetical protein [Pseudohongiellaceae bacterium]
MGKRIRRLGHGAAAIALMGLSGTVAAACEALSILDLNSATLELTVDVEGVADYDVLLRWQVEEPGLSFSLESLEPLESAPEQSQASFSGSLLRAPCVYVEGLGVFDASFSLSQLEPIRFTISAAIPDEQALAPQGAAASSLFIHVANPVIGIDQQAQAIVVARDSNGKVIMGANPIWSSSDESSLSVSDGGLLTGVAVGKSLVQASLDNVTAELDASVYKQDFVSTHGTQFMLNGEPFYVAGANAQQQLATFSEYQLQYNIENAEYFGVNVLRIWGASQAGSLYDDSVETLGVEIDPDDEDILGEYPYHRPFYQYWDTDTQQVAINEGPNGMQFLDRYVYLAKQADIKIAFNLLDNWEWYWGGVNQYVVWHGGNRHGDFFIEEDIKQTYRDWVSYLLNRENIYTGVKYKDEPTIMSWELLNEAGCYHTTESQSILPHDGDDNNPCNGQIVEAWISEMAAYVKSLDPNHLVTVGAQGHFTDSYDEQMGEVYSAFNEPDMGVILSDPNIDLANYHMYPYEVENGDGSLTPLQWGIRFIEDRLALGDLYNKPVVLEEFGATEFDDLQELIDPWLSILYEHNRAGFFFYDLASYIAPNQPTYGDTAPSVAWNIYPDTPGAELLKAWVDKYRE